MSTTAQVIIYLAVLIPSVILHEISHGWIAYKCGDDTAKRAGRLTLNPFAHLDPIGSVLMPLMFALAHIPPFGYAKPVPVNVNRLRKPRNQSVYVALAGPAMTIVLAAIGWAVASIMIISHFGWSYQSIGPFEYLTPNSYLLWYFIYFGLINMLLFVFNMLPIPPLDGSAVVERLWPRKHLASYFEFRRRAMPVLIILVLASFFFHWTDGAANWLQNKYFSILPTG